MHNKEYKAAFNKAFKNETNVECTKCHYKWKYKGKSTYYATCPMCKTPIKLGGKQNGQR